MCGPAWPVPSQPRLHACSPFHLSPHIPCHSTVPSCPPDLLSFVSCSRPVQTDWGQSVLKVGRRCIATLRLWVGIWPISSSHASYPAYMHSPTCLPMATHHLGSPQDTCGPSGLLHMAYCLAGLPVRTPSSLSDWSFCQDSMHSGVPSAIQALIGKWVPLGHHWLRLYHMALHLSGTWSGHLCTMIHMRNLWKAVVHLQG